MRYRFIINGIRFVPKLDFANRWQAFMWLNSFIEGRNFTNITIEEVKND